MDNVKDDNYFASKILADITFLIEHTKSITRRQLTEDEVLQDCVMFRLVQIAENASRLTQEFKIRHKNIDWQAINGLRNRIVRDYGKVDLGIIYDTVKDDLPTLKAVLSEI